jgi:hypothetical protein
MGAPTDLTYVSVWACKYITILFPIIGKADVFTGEAWPKGPLSIFSTIKEIHAMKGVVIIIYGSVTYVKVIVNLGKSLWMNCTIESFTERPIFIKVATIPWVGTIGHSGPFKI